MLSFCSVGGAMNICIHTVYMLQAQFYSFNPSLFFSFLNFKMDQKPLDIIVLIMN